MVFHGILQEYIDIQQLSLRRALCMNLKAGGSYNQTPSIDTTDLAWAFLCLYLSQPAVRPQVGDLAEAPAAAVIPDS